MLACRSGDVFQGCSVGSRSKRWIPDSAVAGYSGNVVWLPPRANGGADAGTAN